MSSFTPQSRSMMDEMGKTKDASHREVLLVGEVVQWFEIYKNY